MLGASRNISRNPKFKAFEQEQFYVEITREGWVYGPLLKEQFCVEKPTESERAGFYSPLFLCLRNGKILVRSIYCPFDLKTTSMDVIRFGL